MTRDRISDNDSRGGSCDNGGCQTTRGESLHERGVARVDGGLGGNRGVVCKNTDPYILQDNNKRAYGIFVGKTSEVKVTPMNWEGRLPCWRCDGDRSILSSVI